MYGKVANDFFQNLKERRIKGTISKSVKEEFDAKRKERYDVLISIIRDLWNEIENIKLPTILLTLDSIFTLVREKIEKPYLLNLLELQIIQRIENLKIEEVKDVLQVLPMDVSSIKDEFERKYLFEMHPMINEKDIHGKNQIEFERLGIHHKDAVHLAAADEYSKTENCRALFITLDHELLRKAREVQKISPINITSPLYFAEKLENSTIIKSS
jgi:hypothetical protein